MQNGGFTRFRCGCCAAVRPALHVSLQHSILQRVGRVPVLLDQYFCSVSMVRSSCHTPASLGYTWLAPALRPSQLFLGSRSNLVSMLTRFPDSIVPMSPLAYFPPPYTYHLQQLIVIAKLEPLGKQQHGVEGWRCCGSPLQVPLQPSSLHPCIPPPAFSL